MTNGNVKVCVQNVKLFFTQTSQNFQTSENFQTLEKIFLRLFLTKMFFLAIFFFKEFFIAFKTITLYKRDMYVFA